MFLHVFHTSFTRLSHVFHVFHRFMSISALIAPPPPLHYLVQHAFIVIASLFWFSTYFDTSFTSFIRFCLYLQTRNVKFHVFQMLLHVFDTSCTHLFSCLSYLDVQFCITGPHPSRPTPPLGQTYMFTAFIYIFVYITAFLYSNCCH